MSDNIKVVVKVRPLISREIEDKLFYQWRVQNDTLYQIDQNGKDVGPEFTFDKVYNMDTKTSDVYNDIAKPIVEAATAGFNGTIFAYGQTSSGKTYTMTGTEEAPGIIPLAILNLFEIIKNIPNRDFLVRVSYMEIYNETLIDLLNIEKKNIKIQDSHQGVKVDATEKVTSSPEEVLDYMKQGKANRQTAATNMNEESSRSHSIFQITIESREHVEGEEECGCVNVSQLNLVDLAGSERAGQTGATGLRFKEGTHINKSLSSLALVIKQLSDDPNRHVNYRDSKLTRILQNSLGGNAKTSIICAVTPAMVEETISTLQFANRAKSIKNKPAVNAVATNATMIQQLTKQLSTLKTELENKKSLEKDNCNLQKQIAALQRLILNGFGQRSTAEILNPRRKLVQPRRITISTLHSIQEDPIPTVPKFCTPSLKYNPLVVSGAPEFQPIQTATSLPTLPEEPVRLVTPPPKDKKVNFDSEIIELDSDDDSSPEVQTCPTSPYHKCYESSKTPPCILRKNAKRAEKNLKDIVELTEREKIFTPSVVELMEKLDQNATVIAKLEDEINKLSILSQEKDIEMEKLRSKINKAEEEMNVINSAKFELENICKEYNTKLTDSEVSYETLKKKAKSREEELLSLLEEQSNKKSTVCIGKIPTTNENEDQAINFLEVTHDISLVNSDNEKSVITFDPSLPMLNQISDLQRQITLKDDKIRELELSVSAQKLIVDSLEKKCGEYQNDLENYKEKLSSIEKEVINHKTSVDNLNKIIETQNQNIQSYKSDIESYKKLVQELQIKLRKKDNINISDKELENLIAAEENYIANNENILNIIQSFKIALKSKNEEIKSLKMSIEKSESSQIDKILAELTNKDKDIETFKEEIQTLKSDINKMLLQQTNWEAIEKELNVKLYKLEESNSNLTCENERYLKQIQNIKEEHERLSDDLLKKDHEIKTTYEKHLKEIEDKNNQIKNLEIEISTKDNTISVLNKTNEETQEHFAEAKSALSKVQSIVTLLTGDIQNVPDIIDNFVLLFRTLVNDLSKLEKIASNIMVQKEQLIDLVKQCDKEYVVVGEKIDDIIESLNDTINIDISCKNITQNVSHSNNEQQFGNGEINQLISRRQLAYEKLINKIDKLLVVLDKKQNLIEQNMRSKDSEISDLKVCITNHEIKLKEKTRELLSGEQEMDDATRKRDQILKNILSKCIDLTINFNIENNISCNLDNNEENTYEEILLILHKIANHIEVTSNKNKEDNLDDALNEAKKQIIELTEQNLAFMNDISRMETTNVDISEKLEKIRQENKDLAEDLEKTGKILGSLRQELKRKVGEMDSIEIKARQWKDQFDTLDFLMKEQLHALRIENTHFRTRFSGSTLKINDNYLENCESDCTTENSSEQSLRSDSKIVLKSPLSLVSLCCNRIIEAIKPNESQRSESNTNISVVNEQHISCQCDKFEFELKMMKEENSKLESIVSQLQSSNHALLREHNEVQNEVKSLLDITYELQKKVVNHRTNLSTLTATTYAENKSLSSQVKFLQHLHNRFHTVCQRDIPSFKNQLQELMTLLKSENLIPSESIKRFSLPNTLDSTTINSNFKNESTLDGDLLMLDTNVTLTTSGETTLVGDDQACFDVTQVCVYNEVACQTIDLPVTEPNLLNSQMTAVSTENYEIMEKLDELKKENNKLREMVIDYSTTTSRNNRMDVQTSPIKTMDNSNEFSEATYKDLLSRHESVLKDVDLLNQKISSLDAEKLEIQKKYNNLLLEIPSTDALVKKLCIFEKEYNCKVKEIETFKSQLQNKNKENISLQIENDNLSTQVMEVISELDDLKKEYDDLKTKNTQISVNNLQLQNDIEKLKHLEETAMSKNCSECETKDKLINSLQHKITAESHVILSRSLSDSDRSSNYTTICTLQNELHAGKEDCNKLKEEVTTIKNHLDRSNLSMTQAMDLDESMSESNNFTCANDFDLIESKCSMPHIPEERPVDIYALDKADCLSFYTEITGNTQDLVRDIKIIDIMKLFYTNVMTKHANEVENLVNKLRDFEDYKKQLELQLENITKEYSCKTKELQEKATELQLMNDSFIVIKDNILLVNNNKEIEYSDIIKSFNENVLKLLDSKFGLNSSMAFESVLNIVVNKFKTDLDEKSNQCCKLECNMRNIQEELDITNSNLTKLRSELIEKENDYDLLKKQKESIQEINSAITLDIVKKEQELDKMITDGFKKLSLHNILNEVDINQLLPTHKNFDALCDLVIKQFNDRHVLIEQHKNNIIHEVESLKTTIETKDVELRLLTERLREKENDLLIQTNLVKDLNQIYDTKVEENKMNLAIVQKLTTLKNDVNMKEQNKCLEDQIKELLQSKEDLKTEINNLKSINNKIVKEKEDYAKLLEESSNTIKENKKQVEAMTSDILILKESVKENVNIIENMKLEIKSQIEQNTQLKEQLQEKIDDCSRLQMNIKTHEKTSEIQSRMITRLQRQKEEDGEKDKQLGELKQKCEGLQKERDSLQHDIMNCREELRLVQGVKETLEAQIAELQEHHKPRLSMEATADVSRRRRQSIHDSKRFSEDRHEPDEHHKIEAVFGARSRNDDFFMDVDSVESNRSTPLRMSKGRDSSQFKTDQSDKDDDPPSRPSSVMAARRRRQSLHDLHRSVSQTPSPHDNQRILKDIQDVIKPDNHDSEVTELRKQLTTCQEELEDLREKYKELDEECETCAQYLRERDEQCIKLKKEKRALETAVNELQAQLENRSMNRSGRRNSVSDAAVNTDEDWSNLHSVVVDRMSYDAEVEKNKKLTKVIEELRFKKQGLTATIAKMQKALEKKPAHNNRDRELDATKSELRACKEELEELKVRIKELDEECDTCAEYLRERDEQCRKLKEAKAALEVKLKEYEDDASNITLSVRKRRQTLHDQNRHSTPSELVDASTETNEDFLSYQVEKDNSKLPDDIQRKEIKRLRIVSFRVVERLSQQKAALEQRAQLAPAPAPLYVATGSAIVQNQQLTDVMKENQKLKKINAKLIHICKKRGKTLSESNRENQDPSEHV